MNPMRIKSKEPSILIEIDERHLLGPKKIENQVRISLNNLNWEFTTCHLEDYDVEKPSTFHFRRDAYIQDAIYRAAEAMREKIRRAY